MINKFCAGQFQEIFKNYNAYKRKISLLSVQPNNSIEERKDSIRFEDTLFKREIFYSHSPRTNNVADETNFLASAH